MRNRLAIIFTLVLLMAGLSFTARASNQCPDSSLDNQTEGRDGHFLAGRKMGRIGRYLELTDDQKSQIKSMVEAERPTIQPLAQQLRQNRRDMREATREGA